MDLFFRKIGEGQPLIILHGLFGMSDNWMTVAKKLSSDYCLYLVDLRNHGRSPHHRDFNYEVMTDDLLHFFEQNDLNNAFLLGHSMGGKVALNFTSRFHEKVKKLIVVDIAPKRYKNTEFSTYINALLSLDLKALKSRKDAGNQILEKLHIGAELVQFLLKNLDRTENGNFKWRINLMPIKVNIENVLGEISLGPPLKIPALFMKGSESHYITPDDEAVIKKYFPNAQIKEIAGANHWVHSSAPVLFERSLRKFLKD